MEVSLCFVRLQSFSCLSNKFVMTEFIPFDTHYHLSFLGVISFLMFFFFFFFFNVKMDIYSIHLAWYSECRLVTSDQMVRQVQMPTVVDLFTFLLHIWQFPVCFGSSITWTEVRCTPSSTQPGFKFMTFRSWHYVSCHWDACFSGFDKYKLILTGSRNLLGMCTHSCTMEVYSCIIKLMVCFVFSRLR